MDRSDQCGGSARGDSYSELIHGLGEAGVEVNRKMLADVAIRDPEAFHRFAELARKATPAA